MGKNGSILRNLKEVGKYGCFRGSGRRDTGNVGGRKKYREIITEAGNCGQNFWDSVRFLVVTHKQ